METELAAHLEHLNLYILLVLFFASLLTGRFIEWAHFRSLEAREAKIGEQSFKTSKLICIPKEYVRETKLVCGEAVIAAEFSRWLMGAFKAMFGGNVRSYESIIDRTRREALLRMYEAAGNAVEIVNVRLEYAPISYGISSKSSCVEAIAYGTAVYMRADGVQENPA